MGNVEIAKERALICKGCDKLVAVVHVCKECGCFMPAKMLLTNATCPLGKWKKE